MTDSEIFPSSYSFYELDFGRVPKGKALVKTFTLKNTSQVHLQYIATRNPKINPIYHVFDLNRYEFYANPGCDVTIKIIYKPNVSGVSDLDSFKIIDTHLNLKMITVQGSCYGPEIVGSIPNLRFFKTNSIDLNETFKVFELKNLTDIPTAYHFDENEPDKHKGGTFKVDKLRGTLQPFQALNITVKFIPEHPGSYAKNLTCLLSNHNPLIVKLFGVYSSVEEEGVLIKKIDYRTYPLPLEDRVDYSGFLSDTVTLRKTIPPVSLSCNCIDFGGVVLNDTKCQTLTTNLTNHMETNDVFIQWDDDNTFEIVPKQLNLPPGASALFECRFHPRSEANLYGKILQGVVFWGDDCENIPLTMNLRLIGHSFAPHQSWIPDVTITPNVIVLPLTLPTFPSWTTFTITSNGHLPVLFKFLPPKKTNYVIKPSMGLVRSYQIVVVQLQSNSPEPSCFIETWNVELNGRGENQIPIYIKGQTALPSITVGDDDVLEFEPVQPNCEGFMFASIRNTSCCPLIYRVFNDAEQGFGIVPTSGRLGPYEEAFVNASCFARKPDVFNDVRREFFIKCQAQAILADDVVTGLPFDVSVKVISTISYSELCATPKNCHVGEVSWGSTINLRFYLYNFGNSTINFYLSTPPGESGKSMINPRQGKCGPREKVMIVVSHKATDQGMKMIEITYFERVNEFSSELSENPARLVFEFDFIAAYPSIQIAEIIEHNFGRLFSRITLWEMLDLDVANESLATLTSQKSNDINLTLPEFETNCDKIYTIRFLVENRSHFDACFALKRRQNCDCTPKEMTHGLTTRKKVLECPHRDAATLEISNPIIKANSHVVLTLKVRYFLPALVKLTYIAELTHSRCVEININIFTITKEEPVISVYNLSDDLNLGRVFIGFKEAPLQAFWVYNNTSIPLPVRIDDVEITKLCNCEGFEVLKCLNNTEIVQPYTARPLLFRFTPIEEKSYQIHIQVLLATKIITIRVHGEGVATIQPWYRKDDGKTTSSTFTMDYLSTEPVRLSCDFLLLDPILVWNCTERLIFIKNHSDCDEINYNWKPCFIDGVVRIDFTKREGVLRGKETHTIVIKIESLSEPCAMRFLLSCEVLNKSQQERHEDSLIEYRKRKAMITEEFTITEKGITYPKTTVYSAQRRDGGVTSFRYIKFQENEVRIVPAPEIFEIAVLVELNVVSELDKDVCLPIDQQFRQIPYKSVDVNASEFLETCNATGTAPLNDLELDKNVIGNVMHCLAADAVFSAYFFQTLRDLKEEPLPIYSQVRFNPSEMIRANKTKSQLKNETIQKCLNKPQATEVASIFQQIVVDSIHETFLLGPPFRTSQSN